jgi:hypothetical protein
MKNTVKIVSAGLFLCIAVSCTKTTDTGISLSIKGVTTTASLKKSASVTGFTFTEALLGIKQIELKREGEKLHDSTMVRDTLRHKFHFNGRYLIDLLAGTSTPQLGLVNFVPGVYNKFESETARLIPGGKSISVKGSYTGLNATVYNFDFSSRSEFEFEFESDSGFVLTEGKVLDMLINVNLPLLFSGIDFSKGIADANNVIVINDTTNIDLCRKIKRNIRLSGEMHEDHEHHSGPHN